MASSHRSFAAALLFVMLFMATELGTNTVMVAEAKDCPTPSKKYSGPCADTERCKSVCEKEGFTGGGCVPPRCVCYKPC